MNLIQSLIVSTLVAGTLSPSLCPAIIAEAPTDLSQVDKPMTIKVLVAQKKEKIFLEARGSYHVYQPVDGKQLSSGNSSKRAFVISDPLGLKWKERYLGSSHLRIVPGDAQSTLLVDGIEYRGCLEIYDMGGKLNIVNEVSLEHYLKSCLTSQFQEEMDEDVMDSIAIVARTNAQYLVSRKPNAPWHVEAQEVGYQGYALTLQNLHVDRSIDNTKNLILTYQDQPFAATWTEDSAGKTADFAAMFRRSVATPRGVQAPFALRDREKHHWSFSLSRQELSKLLQTDKITSIDLFQDKQSEKVYAVKIQDTRGSHNIDFIQLQKALGEKRLKSSDFTIQFHGENITFNGYGQGYGVGLCLYSANAMAEHGENAKKILATFFPETKLQNVQNRVK
ncbi:MAG: SpoIID/LytB domain-containing protein [Rhabdochlamydiaceae bacterium]|nr:SpoIID/LytB domain-containing protein [Rhabdochlamydiaceae bacterium]